MLVLPTKTVGTWAVQQLRLLARPRILQHNFLEIILEVSTWMKDWGCDCAGDWSGGWAGGGGCWEGGWDGLGAAGWSRVWAAGWSSHLEGGWNSVWADDWTAKVVRLGVALDLAVRAVAWLPFMVALWARGPAGSCGRGTFSLLCLQSLLAGVKQDSSPNFG
jgi:hypothetical protein